MKCIKNIWFNSVLILLMMNCNALKAQIDTICFNDTILYELDDSQNAEYEWTISGGSLIYSSANKDSVIVVWNISTGLHYVEVIKFTKNNCTSAPERLDVYVYTPSVDLGEDITFCEDENELIVIDPYYVEYLWNDRTGTNEYIIGTGGIIKLDVKDKYGCWAGDSISVIEINKPIPEFTVNIDTSNSSVSLINLSDTTWQYHWDFGDGNFSDEYNPEIHTYSEPGTYEILINANANGCSGTLSKEVSINEPLIADFTVVYDDCAPVEIEFINFSLGADSYYWDFGNGYSSTDETPVVLYNQPGIYEVTLYAKKDTLTSISKKSIIVNEAPVANFDISFNEANTFNEIAFINKSTNAFEYLWDFGDGENSALYEPTHSYSLSGIYDVSLSVWSEAGCFDSIKINNAITIRQDCRILFPSGFIPNKNGPSGGYYDMSQSVDNNEVFHPIYENLETYELKIYNRWGELIFISRNINIGWDGYYKGKLAPQETYIYQVKARCISGKEISAIGSVTLIY